MLELGADISLLNIAMLVAAHYVLLMMFRSFFAAQSPKSLGRSSQNFAVCLRMTRIFEFDKKNWTLRKNGAKNIKISAISCDISGMKQYIVKRKTALQTAITSAHDLLIR